MRHRQYSGVGRGYLIGWWEGLASSTEYHSISSGNWNIERVRQTEMQGWHHWRVKPFWLNYAFLWLIYDTQDILTHHTKLQWNIFSSLCRLFSGIIWNIAFMKLCFSSGFKLDTKPACMCFENEAEWAIIISLCFLCFINWSRHTRNMVFPKWKWYTFWV